MIKKGAQLGKIWMQKAHVSQKNVLYFKGVTVNTENYSQRSRSLHLRDKRHKTVIYSSERKTRKEKEESKELSW